MIHKDTIENYTGNLQELAAEIGDLKYNALSDFLHLLADKIEQDGKKDKARNRVKLAANLQQSADQLRAAKEAIDKAWVICEPYTK